MAAGDFNEEDLKLIMTVDPDTTAVDKALKDMASTVDDISDAGMDKITSALVSQRSQFTEINRLLSDQLSSVKDEDGFLRTARNLHEDRLTGAKQLTDEILRQRDAQAAMRTATDPVLAALRERLGVDKEVTAQMEHQAALMALRAQMEPDTLSKAVAKQRELLAVQNELSKAQDKEHREQSRPGFFQKLLQDPARAIAGMTAGLSRFVADMKDEFSKGGVGGLLDKATGAGGGATTGGGGATNVLLGGILGGQGGGGTMGQVGGMLGEALGGPVGAVIGETVAKSVQAGIEMPAKIISGGFKLIGSSLNELNGTLGPIGLGLSLATGAAESFVSTVSAMSPVLGAVIGPLAEVPGALKGILETLVGFSAKASPVSVQMFQFAIEDLQAVIGGSFLPVLEMMTQGVRLVGDALATVLPNSVEVREALNDVRRALSEAGTAIRQALAEAGPAIRKDLIDGLRLLSEAAAITVRAMVYVGEWVKENWDFIMFGLSFAVGAAGAAITVVALAITVAVSPLILLAVTVAAPFIALGIAMYGVYRGVKALLQMFGLIEAATSSATGGIRSSVGAASRSGKIEGIEEYQRSLQLDALSAPGSASMSEVPNMLSQVVRWTEQFTIDNLVRALMSAYVTAPVSTATTTVNAARSLWNRMF